MKHVLKDLAKTQYVYPQRATLADGSSQSEINRIVRGWKRLFDGPRTDRPNDDKTTSDDSAKSTTGYPFQGDPLSDDTTRHFLRWHPTAWSGNSYNNMGHDKPGDLVCGNTKGGRYN